MGLGEPQTKADCLREIENLTETLAHLFFSYYLSDTNIAE